MNFGSVS